jgi:hypothetical protein
MARRCWPAVTVQYVDRTFKDAAIILFSTTVFIVGLTAMVKAVPCSFSLLPSKEQNAGARGAEAAV